MPPLRWLSFCRHSPFTGDLYWQDENNSIVEYGSQHHSDVWEIHRTLRITYCLYKVKDASLLILNPVALDDVCSVLNSTYAVSDDSLPAICRKECSLVLLDD